MTGTWMHCGASMSLQCTAACWGAWGQRPKRVDRLVFASISTWMLASCRQAEIFIHGRRWAYSFIDILEQSKSAPPMSMLLHSICLTAGKVHVLTYNNDMRNDTHGEKKSGMQVGRVI
ncbi:hypothetical protein PAXRUDRAFT_518388 [Paxillus rubicundulus Ve08.2h10]|uniref:Secreted protein n=1 Tax=Paxillus rubicundulus Ve08.2h10 TaxID=930991 RepID=A0A0D0DC62_9AGAM|nr:hypothetical protein PAXRUDRAFT_518388 [Paxillus rubicundulus Ve08.2h10]